MFHNNRIQKICRPELHEHVLYIHSVQCLHYLGTFFSPITKHRNGRLVPMLDNLNFCTVVCLHYYEQVKSKIHINYGRI